MPLSNLVAVVSDHDSVVAINPDNVTSVGPRTDGSSLINFRDGSSLAVQDDFQTLTGIDPEATLEEAKEAKEEKAKEKAAEEAKAAKAAKEAA